MNRKSLISFCNIPGIFDCRVYSPETYAYTIRNKHAEVADVFKLKRTFGYILKIPRGCNNGGDDAVLCRPPGSAGGKLSDHLAVYGSNYTAPGKKLPSRRPRKPAVHSILYQRGDEDNRANQISRI